MNSIFRRKTLIAAIAVISLGASATVANATNSWGGYHWARTANPFTLELGDNVSTAWDSYLATTSKDWSESTVLDTTIVPGRTKGNCQPTTGRVEVCNKTYGATGWLGVASVWVSGTHIVKGTVKLNDTYFNTATYNTTAWKNLVMCQEVGHTFGLDHQDETLANTNLGTCMDYTNDPDGTVKGQLSNVRPNQHDYDQLITIYSHPDSTSTTTATTSAKGNSADVNTDDPSGWGKEIRKDAQGRSSLFEKDLGNGERVFTFVVWIK